MSGASSPRARGWIVPVERSPERGDALGIDVGDLGAIEQAANRSRRARSMGG